jgi:hypothetical protein
MMVPWFGVKCCILEINDSQRAAWSKAIEVFDEGAQRIEIAQALVQA